MLCRFSHVVWLFVTPWTVAPQAPLSMDSPGKNTGVGCHALLSPGHLPNPGIKPESSAAPASQGDSLPLSYWLAHTHANWQLNQKSWWDTHLIFLARLWRDTVFLHPVHPRLLKYTCRITLYKFKLYMFIWYTYILQNGYHPHLIQTVIQKYCTNLILTTCTSQSFSILSR